MARERIILVKYVLLVGGKHLYTGSETLKMLSSERFLAILPSCSFSTRDEYFVSVNETYLLPKSPEHVRINLKVT